MSVTEAAQQVGIGRTLFKKICRREGIASWPQVRNDESSLVTGGGTDLLTQQGIACQERTREDANSLPPAAPLPPSLAVTQRDRRTAARASGTAKNPLPGAPRGHQVTLHQPKAAPLPLAERAGKRSAAMLTPPAATPNASTGWPRPATWGVELHPAYGDEPGCVPWMEARARMRGGERGSESPSALLFPGGGGKRQEAEARSPAASKSRGAAHAGSPPRRRRWVIVRTPTPCSTTVCTPVFHVSRSPLRA